MTVAFQEGDTLTLEYYDPQAGGSFDVPSVDKIVRRVAYVLNGGQFGIEPGYVVLGLAEKDEEMRATQAADEIERLRLERDELQQAFDMRRKANSRAIKHWQQKTGKTLTWPDHADLCVWLFEEIERLMGTLQDAVDMAVRLSEKYYEAADEIERLRAESERLREALSDVVEAWDWWQVDTYDRCQSVPSDAINIARAALAEGEKR